ncbi:mitosis protein dim1 [Citrus sinensis]|nr:mitosis protein dim1 [Citrus sinensis]
MSYLLPHLHSGWAVDQAILTEEERVVIIRFGHDWDDTCMQLRFHPPSPSSVRDRRALPPNIYAPMPQSTTTLLAAGTATTTQSLSIDLGWAVDQAILAEEERLVVIRFGHDWDETCMQMDEVLSSVAETIKNFAVIYLVDISEVPDFNTMYELYDPSTVMFFFRNKHIMIDLGTGNNNKINWALKDKQEFIDIVETVYRGARKGRGLVIAPKDYSTKYRY